MSEPNWIIRVGGCYNHLNYPNPHCRFRVTEIDGDSIHYVQEHKFSHDLEWKAANNHVSGSRVFRMVYAPEDASPLPAMIALLEKLIGVAERGAWQSEGRYLAHEARELLASQKVLP